jgi:hypothetical protein
VKPADPIEENNRDVEEARGRRGSRAEHRDRASIPAGEPVRMDATEIESELVRMGILLPFLNTLRLEDLDREFGMYDAAAPVLDPTSWMRNHENVERNRDVVKALLKAQTAIRKVFGGQLPSEFGR